MDLLPRRTRSRSSSTRRTPLSGARLDTVSRTPDDGPTIVVADDERAIRTLFGRALERDGFVVLLAADGRQALELARSGPVSVMVLDLHMPRMDGFETLKRLRAHAGLRTLPVVLVTGSSTEADRLRALDMGAVDVVVKPVAIAELVARVRAQVRGRDAWAEQADRSRQHRRRVTALLEELPHDAPLLSIATDLAERLPAVLDVEAVAILRLQGPTPRCIAATGDLRERFPPGAALPSAAGAEIAKRSVTGPWLETTAAPRGFDRERLDFAFVPFSLGATSTPIGCLVYGQRPDPARTPLGHRLADLIDATDQMVASLRPAIEHAETTSAAVVAMRQIITGRRFTIHVQPIARLDTGVVMGVEALTRFADGMRPDLRFAEAARLGLSLALERTTVEAAIEAAVSLPADVALSLNVSPHVLQHERKLPRILAGARRPVIVELTEQERIDDYDAISAAIRRLGPDVELAVDDVGSGYATLRHILRLQPAYVKLDIDWVRGIDIDPIRRSLVSGLSYFARETGCQLIAEGIETPGERKALLELGVRLGQGYLLGRPRPMGRS